MCVVLLGGFTARTRCGAPRRWCVLFSVTRRMAWSRSVVMPCSIASARSCACGASVTMSSFISSVTAKHLVDADAVVVAGVAAEVAAHAGDEVGLLGRPAAALVERPLVGGRRVGLDAVLADPADEALADHAEQRRRDEERLDAHVHEAVQRGGRVGRVQRRHDEVAGERGLRRDARGLDVSDLTDEDRVGVLAQDRTQPGRERQAGRLVDLDLVDRREHVLDRDPRSSRR